MYQPRRCGRIAGLDQKSEAGAGFAPVVGAADEEDEDEEDEEDEEEEDEEGGISGAAAATACFFVGTSLPSEASASAGRLPVVVGCAGTSPALTFNCGESMIFLAIRTVAR